MKRGKILVVDDDKRLRESIGMILDNYYEVIFAENGNRCIELFETHNNISLLILDIKLPDIDGIEVLRKIREKKRDIPVIIITAYGTKELLKDVISLGVSGYFDKPFNVNKLLDLINKFLSSKDEIYQRSPKEKIELAKEIIDKNHNVILSLKEVAEKVYLEPKYFSRCFKKIVGENFYNYQIRKKIEKVKELLTNTDYSITEICYEVGYSELSCFTKMFKKVIGVCPNKYRKNNNFTYPDIKEKIPHL
jgi:YesN/AraC family two-component response regulator